MFNHIRDMENMFFFYLNSVITHFKKIKCYHINFYTAGKVLLGYIICKEKMKNSQKAYIGIERRKEMKR